MVDGAQVHRSASNEGRACDAVARVLEARTGHQRADVWSPDKSGETPPVDLRMSLGAQQYAIEHTQIEAFAGQIGTEEVFRRFIEPVREELSGTLPGPALYTLVFPLDSRIEARARKLDDIRSDFICWLRERCQELNGECPERPTRISRPSGHTCEWRGTPPSFPYEVKIVRETHWARSSRFDGKLQLDRPSPNNLEAKRLLRIRTAFDKKCQKLLLCMREGVRTVLVLESADLFLSNEMLIVDCLLDIIRDQDDLPNEIYLVETSLDDVWTVRCMQHGDEYIWGDVDPPEFQVDELVDVMALG